MELVDVLRRYRRTAVVALVGGLLALQSVYSFAVHPEPYPTIRMPAFGAAGAASGEFELRTAKVAVEDRDGRSESIRVQQVMSGFPFSVSAPTFAYLFAPDAPDPDPATVAWLTKRLEKVTGRSDLRAMRVCWQDQTIRIDDASVVSAAPCTWRQVSL